MAKVRKSDTGMEYSTPYSPKNRGSSRAKPTPNTISRTYVDMDDSGHGTPERRRKKSFCWYQNVIRSNGEEL